MQQHDYREPQPETQVPGLVSENQHSSQDPQTPAGKRYRKQRVFRYTPAAPDGLELVVAHQDAGKHIVCGKKPSQGALKGLSPKEEPAYRQMDSGGVSSVRRLMDVWYVGLCIVRCISSGIRCILRLLHTRTHTRTKHKRKHTRSWEE